jgi:hypothetical protein
LYAVGCREGERVDLTIAKSALALLLDAVTELGDGALVVLAVEDERA